MIFMQFGYLLHLVLFILLARLLLGVFQADRPASWQWTLSRDPWGQQNWGSAWRPAWFPLLCIVHLLIQLAFPRQLGSSSTAICAFDRPVPQDSLGDVLIILMSMNHSIPLASPVPCTACRNEMQRLCKNIAEQSRHVTRRSTVVRLAAGITILCSILCWHDAARGEGSMTAMLYVWKRTNPHVISCVIHSYLAYRFICSRGLAPPSLSLFLSIRSFYWAAFAV